MKSQRNFLILLLFFIGCTKSNYPPQIIKYNLESKYDSAKWVVYMSNYHSNFMYCYQNQVKMFLNQRKELINNNNIGYIDTANIIECNIDLEELNLKKDTILMRFVCFYKDSFELCHPKDKFFMNQIIFIKESPTIYRIETESTYDSVILRLQREIEKDTLKETGFEYFGFYPLRVEEKSFPVFLQNFKGNINTWLKKEAIKRGILKE